VQFGLAGRKITGEKKRKQCPPLSEGEGRRSAHRHVCRGGENRIPGEKGDGVAAFSLHLEKGSISIAFFSGREGSDMGGKGLFFCRGKGRRSAPARGEKRGMFGRKKKGCFTSITT